MSAVGIKAQIERDEGRVEYAYQDSMEGKCEKCGKSNGYWTIGTGHLVDRRRNGRLPGHIIDALLDYDITQATEALYTAFPWAAELDEPRRAVLVNMVFQLGLNGLAQFHRALGYMKNGEYTAASLAFADSRVAREQTPERWKRHCEQIKTGRWQ